MPGEPGDDGSITIASYGATRERAPRLVRRPDRRDGTHRLAERAQHAQHVAIVVDDAAVDDPSGAVDAVDALGAVYGSSVMNVVP